MRVEAISHLSESSAVHDRCLIHTRLSLSAFTSKLVPAIQNTHKNSTESGRGKGLLVLTEPILIETYTGLMSFIGNRNKLGYSLARGSIGF
uniref:Uncharacterized protein n=1 Tax=Capra hircus TaxID=9925 RepID=A0A8C2QSH9_CAPHI